MKEGFTGEDKTYEIVRRVLTFGTDLYIQQMSRLHDPVYSETLLPRIYSLHMKMA